MAPMKLINEINLFLLLTHNMSFMFIALSSMIPPHNFKTIYPNKKILGKITMINWKEPMLLELEPSRKLIQKLMKKINKLYFVVLLEHGKVLVKIHKM